MISSATCHLRGPRGQWGEEVVGELPQNVGAQNVGAQPLSNKWPLMLA